MNSKLFESRSNVLERRWQEDRFSPDYIVHDLFLLCSSTRTEDQFIKVFY